MRSHAWIDRRSLALHEAVASKLEARPELVAIARDNLARWLADRPSPALVEWRDLLDRATLREVVELLRSPSETASRLRQSSPFAGVLTPAERQEILDIANGWATTVIDTSRRGCDRARSSGPMASRYCPDRTYATPRPAVASHDSGLKSASSRK